MLLNNYAKQPTFQSNQSTHGVDADCFDKGVQYLGFGEQ